MGIFQVVANQRWLGQEIRNVLHYETEVSTLTSGQATEVADDIRAAWATFAASRLDNSWQLYSVTIRRVDVVGIPGQEFGFTSGPLTGPVSVESMPTQIALLVHGVAFVPPPNRVRSYLGGLGEGSIVDGLWNAATRTAALGWAGDVASLSVTGLTAFIRVAAEWNTEHSQVIATNPITSYQVSDVPGTQRRRRIGRGS